MPELVFRDGTRSVPDHVTLILKPFEEELYTLTYDQAMDLANREMLRAHESAAFQKTIRDHFDRLGER